MSFLVLDRVSSAEGKEPIRDVTLNVRDGEMLALMGATGAGKTTLVRCVAGLDPVVSGRIELAGKDITKSRPGDRDVAVVFPSYSLYYHMSVRENISFPLRMKRESRRVIEARVSEAAEMLGIGHLLERRLTQISGGERQRVSIGRAVVRRPQLFLFDEPFMSLDLKLREQLRVDLRTIQEALGVAAVFVTSDPSEALMMGHRVASIDEGRILQVADPSELYETPATVVVGDQMTTPRLNRVLVRGEIVKEFSEAVTLADVFAKRVDETVKSEKAVTAAFRPEETILCEPSLGAAPARVSLVESLGDVQLVKCNVGDEVVVAHHRGTPPALGAEVNVRVMPGRIMLFDADSGIRLAGDSSFKAL